MLRPTHPHRPSAACAAQAAPPQITAIDYTQLLYAAALNRLDSYDSSVDWNAEQGAAEAEAGTHELHELLTLLDDPHADLNGGMADAAQHGQPHLDTQIHQPPGDQPAGLPNRPARSVTAPKSLIPIIGVIYCLYCLHQTQPVRPRVNIYTPLPLLQLLVQGLQQLVQTGIFEPVAVMHVSQAMHMIQHGLCSRCCRAQCTLHYNAAAAIAASHASNSQTTRSTTLLLLPGCTQALVRMKALLVGAVRLPPHAQRSAQRASVRGCSQRAHNGMSLNPELMASKPLRDALLHIRCGWGTAVELFT